MKMFCYGIWRKLVRHIGSPNLKVTASIFVKRYAFLAVIYLYGMTAWNKKLNVSLNNISIQTEEADRHVATKILFSQYQSRNS